MQKWVMLNGQQKRISVRNVRHLINRSTKEGIETIPVETVPLEQVGKVKVPTPTPQGADAPSISIPDSKPPINYEEAHVQGALVNVAELTMTYTDKTTISKDLPGKAKV